LSIRAFAVVLLEEITEDGFEDEDTNSANGDMTELTGGALVTIGGQGESDQPEKKRRNRWGSKAKTMMTAEDLEQFQERLNAIATINRKMMQQEVKPDADDP
jgi:hypothetical protein